MSKTIAAFELTAEHLGKRIAVTTQDGFARIEGPLTRFSIQGVASGTIEKHSEPWALESSAGPVTVSINGGRKIHLAPNARIEVIS